MAPYLGGFSTLYDMTPDGHPIVGTIEEVEGFWCDCGWSGNGFAPAPSGGRSLAQMIMGRDPDIDLSYFQWPRRSGPPAGHGLGNEVTVSKFENRMIGRVVICRTSVT